VIDACVSPTFHDGFGVKIRIEKESPSPIYQQIFDQIRSAIIKGEVESSSRLPSERDLADSLKISRMTVRRAFEKLADSGFITSMGGKGVFVSPPRLDQSVGSLLNFFSDMRKRGLRPESRLLSVKKMKPPKEASDFLYGQNQNDVLRIERLLIANEKPYVHETKYLNYRKCLQLRERKNQIEGTDFKFMDECIKCWVNARVSIGLETLTRDFARKHGFGNCDLAFLVKKKVYTFENEPVSFLLLRYRTDLYTFNLTIFNYSRMSEQANFLSPEFK
jgi:GntR family transcriptional regulator